MGASILHKTIKRNIFSNDFAVVKSLITIEKIFKMIFVKLFSKFASFQY